MHARSSASRSALAARGAAGRLSESQRARRTAAVGRARRGAGAAGDPAGAARVYEELAAQNSGAERNAMLLHAARDYLAARRAEDAARVLASTERRCRRSRRPSARCSTWSWRSSAARAGGVAPAARAARAARRCAGGALPRPAGARRGARRRRAPSCPPRPSRRRGGRTSRCCCRSPAARAGAAISVRDGFMTAYYQAPAAERPAGARLRHRYARAWRTP